MIRSPVLAILLALGAALSGCASVPDAAPAPPLDVDADPSDNTTPATATPAPPASPASPATSATPATTTPAVALGLVVDALPPTVNATVRLTGSLAAPALLSVTGTSAREVPAGTWAVDLVVPHGQTRLTVIADDGTRTEQANVTAVRLAPFTFEVQYGGYPGLDNAVADVLLDIHAFPSKPAYEGRSAPHPGFATVHDLTVQWATATQATVEVAWSESLQGYAMSKINGAGNPLGSSLPPYWVLEVNGDVTDFGMTLMPVVPGDHVAWCLNACV